MRATRTKRSSAGQALVETAVTFLIWLTVIFAAVDFGRAIATKNTLTRAADAAAQELTLVTSKQSDCSAIAAAIAAAPNTDLKADPNSTYGNAGSASTPGPNAGYIYINPAMATSNSICTSGNSRPSGKVSAQVTYTFSPWTPFFTWVHPELVSTSVLQTEY